MGTYADLMSLLLCFFVMLFAMSIIAEPRVQALVDTLRQDFTGFQGKGKQKSRNVQSLTIVSESAARNRRIAALTGGQPIPALQGTSSNVHTILLDGVTVRIIRFELGSDELSGQAELDLRTILPVLRGSPQKIMIKGYAAPEEKEGITSQQNDLAYFRALGVVDHLVAFGLEQGNFEISVEPGTVPNLTLLPAGVPPGHAGASVEVILLNQTTRQLRE